MDNQIEIGWVTVSPESKPPIVTDVSKGMPIEAKNKPLEEAKKIFNQAGWWVEVKRPSFYMYIRRVPAQATVS